MKFIKTKKQLLINQDESSQESGKSNTPERETPNHRPLLRALASNDSNNS
jgi:hypothetical protein